jgi:hypothetical protein
MAAATVIGALRRFLPEFLREHPAQDRARRRALWALTHCRTAAMGGHVYACTQCGRSEFAYHSCNHRSCPQCGRQATAQWVERELSKRVGAPYFMVTFTLPELLRGLFFTPEAKHSYDLFFSAAAEALSQTLANPRWLGAQRSGFTMILHTWNQRLHFHPHLHCIVPGAGLDAAGRVVAVKSRGFLVPQPVLRAAFRARFREKLADLAGHGTEVPAIDPSVWEADWGVHLQAFGDGRRAIQYLGAYVCRTAIGDSRILSIDEKNVTFSWIDRANGNARRIETVSGVEFVRRYLRHVLPLGLRAIRRHGWCHPAARAKRERIAFHTGATLYIGPVEPPPPKPAWRCPCCGTPMIALLRLLAPWNRGRAPPAPHLRCA